VAARTIARAVASTSGVRGNAGQVNYSSARAAVTGMTRTLA
jgi:3-oxoacyl-[acyl-carrier protein] reductase